MQEQAPGRASGPWKRAHARTLWAWRLYPTESAHTGAVLEELQLPVGKTHLGEVCEGQLACDKHHSRAVQQHEEERLAEMKCSELITMSIPHPINTAWRGRRVKSEAERGKIGGIEWRCFYFHSCFSVSYSVIKWQLFFPTLSLVLLWHQLLSDFPVLISIYELFHRIFSYCPAKEGQWESCLIATWQPAKVIPPQYHRANWNCRNYITAPFTIRKKILIS